MFRVRARVSGFIEPCLPSPADCPPIGPNWFTTRRATADGIRLQGLASATAGRRRGRALGDHQRAGVQALPFFLDMMCRENISGLKIPREIWPPVPPQPVLSRAIFSLAS